MARDGWESQVRKGTLEFCVLAGLARGERYGYELARELSAVDGMLTSHGTLYPILARLERDGLVRTLWRESNAGPPRKYYEITEVGRDALTTFAREWERYQLAVKKVLRSAGSVNATH